MRAPRKDRWLPYVVVGGSVLLALTIALVGTLALVSLGRDTPPDELTGEVHETVLIAEPTEEPAEAATPITIPLAQLTPGPDSSPTPSADTGEPTPSTAEAPSVASAAAAPGPAVRVSVESYTVLAGDTLSNIAARYGVEIETLLLANELSDAELLREGQVLYIPPVDGLVHEVQPGETVAAIARQYDVTVEDIGQHNDLDSAYSIQVGQMLAIPGATRPVAQPTEAPAPEPTSPPAPTSTPEPGPTPTLVLPTPTPETTDPAPATAPAFEWPALGSVVRSYSSDHPGIALSGGAGAPAMASAAGTVVSAAQLDTGYGWHIVLDHGNGFSTLYAHLSAIQVSVGQAVDRLQVIGAIGQSGSAEQTHLYFELRQNGLAIDPRPYLP